MNRALGHFVHPEDGEMNEIVSETNRDNYPTNTWHSLNAVSMLAHRLRRWPNIETALGECPVFAGIVVVMPQLQCLSVVELKWNEYKIINNTDITK